MTTLAGKKALVTGGAKRIGRVIALALARDGVDVVLHFDKSRDAAEATAAEIRSHGVRSWLIQADLSTAKTAGNTMNRAISIAGGIDILVNNASNFTSSNLGNLDAAGLARDVQLQALSPLELARPLAASGAAASIVNILDTRIASACFEHTGYYLGKKMLADLTRMMAIEFAPMVRVNGVAPGLILPPEGKDESYMDSLKSNNPLNRTGSPEEVANAVLFLLKSDFITGQVIFVDGGEHLKGATHV